MHPTSNIYDIWSFTGQRQYIKNTKLISYKQASIWVLSQSISCRITCIFSITTWTPPCALGLGLSCNPHLQQSGRAGAAVRCDGCRLWHRQAWVAVQQYLQAAILLFAEHLKKPNCTVAHTPRSRCCHWPAATNSEPTELTDTSAQRIRNHLF